MAILGGFAASLAQASPRQIYQRYRTSVVAVTYYVETNFMRQDREVQGRDVGVLVGDDLVLMNGSVMMLSASGSPPHDFRVQFAGGEERNATFIGRDEFVNVAFLQVEGGFPPGVEPLRFDPKPRLKLGDEVALLTLLPENLSPMVRLASGHVVAQVEKPKPLWITDLNVEDALGAPVFTASGRAVGVLSELGRAGPAFASGLGDEGSYFGIILTAETLNPLVAAPPRKGEARRAWLGITLQALTPEMAEYWGLTERSGIIVNSVVPGSPAEQAGLRTGDLILELDGAPIPVDREDHVPIFIEQVGSAGVGAKLSLGIRRDGVSQEVEVTLAAAPKSPDEAEEYNNPDFELTVRELVFSDYRFNDLRPDFEGVLVSRVEEGSWSSVGGLQRGDIIQKVDDQRIASPNDVKRVLEEATKKERRKLVFFVQRAGRTQFITIQPNWRGQS